ncbi:L,D-transpeptidase [Crocosphaera sp. Alani8]|uniref:L,D-transpeptidase n=1 Tax=Crocosphaera sp. Alani8 TaxID=3038952 RepID=UPI001D8295D6|nr:L,D-transpeptidase [Flavobacteriaceae bacterium]
MKFTLSLLTLTLISGSFLLPIGGINKQAIASEGTTSETSATELPTTSTEQETAISTPPETEKTQATHLVLNLKERRVYAYQDDTVLANYQVAIGRRGWETPKGNFSVIQMVENPQWKNPWNGRVSAAGPNSPLGERWIGFSRENGKYIGFHGTPGEHVMGQAVSHGCVRMRNRDVKALYELVQTGIPVIVQ